MDSRDYLPSVGEPARGLVAQASKGTAAEGGGIFCVPPASGKQAFRAGQDAKKAPNWVPFLLVARREVKRSLCTPRQPGRPGLSTCLWDVLWGVLSGIYQNLILLICHQ